MEVIDIINQVSEYFGLNVASLLGIATGITIVVNFLKATFSKWVTGSVIPYVTGILSLLVSGVTFWGNWIQLIVAAVLITALSIGGWASAKMLAHKVGTESTSKK